MAGFLKLNSRWSTHVSTQTFVRRLEALRARTAFIIRMFHTYTGTPEPLIGSAPCSKRHLCQFVTLLKPGHHSSVYTPPERMLSLLIPDQSHREIKHQPLVWQSGALTSPRLFWTPHVNPPPKAHVANDFLSSGWDCGVMLQCPAVRNWRRTSLNWRYIKAPRELVADAEATVTKNVDIRWARGENGPPLHKSIPLNSSITSAVCR